MPDPVTEHLIDEAIRGLFLDKRYPLDKADELTDEIMDIVREHLAVEVLAGEGTAQPDPTERDDALDWANREIACYQAHADEGKTLTLSPTSCAQQAAWLRSLIRASGEGTAPQPAEVPEHAWPAHAADRRERVWAHAAAGMEQGTAPQVLGYVVLSDHIDRSTGKHGIDLNWDGELHPTRESAEGSITDEEPFAVQSPWARIGTVTLPVDQLPAWWVVAADGAPQEGDER